MRQVFWVHGLAVGLTLALCHEAHSDDAPNAQKTPEQVVHDWFETLIDDDLDLNRISKLAAYPTDRILRDLSDSRRDLELAWTQLDEAAKKRFGDQPLDTADYRRRSRQVDQARKVPFRIVEKKPRKDANGFDVLVVWKVIEASGKTRADHASVAVVKQDGAWRVQARISAHRLFSTSALARWFQNSCGDIWSGLGSDIGRTWDEEEVQQRVRDCHTVLRKVRAELQQILIDIQAGDFADAGELRDRLARMGAFSRRVADSLTDKYQRYRIAIDLRADADDARLAYAVFAFTHRGSLEKRLDGSGIALIGISDFNDPSEKTSAATVLLEGFRRKLNGETANGSALARVRITISIGDDCSWRHLRYVVAACQASGFQYLRCLGKQSTCFNLKIPDVAPDNVEHPPSPEYQCCYSHDWGRTIGMTGIPKPRGQLTPSILFVTYDAKTKVITLSAGGQPPETLEEFAKKRAQEWQPERDQKEGTGPSLIIFAAPHVPFKAVRAVMQRFRFNDIRLDPGNPPTQKPVVFGVEIEIEPDGRYLVAGRLVASPELVKRLEREIKKTPNLIVTIRASPQTPLGFVQGLITKAQAAGVERFHLRLKEPSSP